MPFPFALPTTAPLDLSAHLSSSTHPSLPYTASTYRGVLRDLLKKHKHLPPQQQPSNLPNILSALDEYIPYLLGIDAALKRGEVGGEFVHLLLGHDVDVEWRATLTASLPGLEPPRVKHRGLEYEISFALATLAYAYCLLSRTHLHLLYGPSSPTAEQRTAAVQSAVKHLLQACSVHTYLVSRSSQWTVPSSSLDVSTPIQTGLASLCLAEATLLAVLKDDPYAAAVARERNENDSEWMIKAPDLPKVRAHLFARLCLAANEHAARASAMLSAGGRIDQGLLDYAKSLQRTAKGKACRFLGIDADLGGQIGTAIAWLRGARYELGLATKGGDTVPKAAGFGRWKAELSEKRETRKIEKGSTWGLDAGRLEECRIVEMLEAKWTKINDTVGFSSIRDER